MSKTVKSFADEQTRRGAYARADRGLVSVEVERIVGSVGRASELDPRFRNRRTFRMSRSSDWRIVRLRKLFDAGTVPPLELYQIGDDYFVLDGHHRVAVALERDQTYFDAHVVEYRPDRADPANAVYYERAAFVAATGLREVVACELGRYPRLLSRVQSYHRELDREGRAVAANAIARLLPIAMVDGPRRLNLREAARIWYHDEYRPVVDVLHAEGLPQRFAEIPDGDLYSYVSDHRWYLSERRGWDVGLDVALVDFVHRFAAKTSGETLVDPIVAYGSDVLEQVSDAPLGPLRRITSHPAVAFATGICLLPIAFLRGLRPKDYRIPRSSLGS
jgi:hypothetical protein